jgi:hypothetical protein
MHGLKDSMASGFVDLQGDKRATARKRQMSTGRATNAAKSGSAGDRKLLETAKNKRILRRMLSGGKSFPVPWGMGLRWIRSKCGFMTKAASQRRCAA